MPGPSSPVCGCPLKRVELRSNGRSRSYKDGHHGHPLNLSIESNRYVETNKSRMVLFVCVGSQRFMTLQLSDLIESTQRNHPTISINQSRFQVQFTILKDVVTATFCDARDFNVTVCLLEKLGFKIVIQKNCLDQSEAFADSPTRKTNGPPESDSELNLQSTWSQISSQSSTGQSHHAPNSPQLRSSTSRTLDFRPSQNPSSQQHSPPLSQHSLDRPFSRSPSIGFAPTQAVYNIFSAASSCDPHRPRVSSPLRTSAIPESLLGDLPSPVSNHLLNSYNSISETRRRATSYQPFSTASLEPNNTQSLSASATVQSISNLSQNSSRFMRQHSMPSMSIQQIQKAMPPPRNLPFSKPTGRLQFKKLIEPIVDDEDDETQSSLGKGTQKTRLVTEPDLYSHGGAKPRRRLRGSTTRTLNSAATSELHESNYPVDQSPSGSVSPGESQCSSVPKETLQAGAQKLHGTNVTNTPDTTSNGFGTYNERETPSRGEIKAPEISSDKSPNKNESIREPIAEPSSSLQSPQRKRRRTAHSFRSVARNNTRSKPKATSIERTPEIRRDLPMVRDNPQQQVEEPSAPANTELDYTSSSVQTEMPLVRSTKSLQERPGVMAVPFPVTDTMLNTISNLTSNIMEQWVEDSMNNDSPSELAKYYWNRIMKTRRDFFYNELKRQDSNAIVFC